jgi:hypothetical protein
MSINNTNIILEHDLKFGDILTGYEIMFQHPTGKVVIRDKWTSPHLSHQSRAYSGLGLRGGNLIVKCKVKTETIKQIPEETIRRLKIECPVLFSPPLMYDTEARDISKLGQEVHQQTQHETNLQQGVKLGMQMNGCTQQ